MHVQRVHCRECGVGVEGDFLLPKLARLSSDDREFVEWFVLSGGSITQMEEKLAVSYPTVRKRLDEVIERLKRTPAGPRSRQAEILEQIDAGKISAKEGIALLRQGGKRRDKA